LFDGNNDTIVKDYSTGWVDIPQTRRIYKSEEIVPSCVTAVGHNSKYIIAQQKPIKEGNIVTVDTNTINYYVIEVTNSDFQDKPVYGPLDKMSFDSLRTKLKISDIKFDMHYPEYP
jgi:hypothetical protein